jgi:hypothetical protein
VKLRIARVVVAFLSLVVSATPLTFAQTSTQTVSALPRLVRFGGTAKDLNGSPLTGVVGITFSLYTEQTGGAALWLETQNITADNNGHYTALLGSTKPDGLPADLFNSEQARWVGVQVSGQAEQPRVLLVSAPYALKAGDAETIGGFPPSAFVLAAPAAMSSAAASGADETVTPLTATGVTTTGGTADYLPMFSGAATIVDSVVFQSATSPFKIGINTTTPATVLDVNGAGTIRGTLALPATGAATATAGKDSQGLNLVASSFDSTSSTAVSQTFRLQAEPAANDTTTPLGTLNLLYGLGATAPTETGLKISSKGLVTFATGQTFPGTGAGTITGITTAAGSGLAGGGVKGTLTLSVPAAGITNAMLAHPSMTVTAGTDLTGGGLVALGNTITLNVNTAKIPQLGTANTFTGNQTVTGIVSGTSTAFGVSGSATAASGFSAGVGGTAASPGGYGVEGVNTGSGGIGVYGYDSAGTGVSAFGVTGVSASGTSYGVNASATGAGSTGVYATAPFFGVYGVATSSSGSTVGVYGSGVDGLQGQGTLHGVYAAAPTYGLYGVATNTTGTSFGVYGSGGSNGVYGIAPNFGLYGVATATSGNSVGVYGTGVDGLQGSGTTYGVYAAGTGAGSTGVYGTSPQFGVQGIATGSGGSTVGVFGAGVDGLQGSGTLHGVYAASTGTGSYGVYSYTPTAGAAGTYGVYIGASATGSSWLTAEGGSAAGVWADTNGNNETYYIPALLATTDDDFAATFVNNSDEVPTTSAYNNGSGGTSNVIRAEGTAGSCTLTGSGDTACTGVLKSVVATTSGAGARRVETYSMQSPENWFEDFGSGALSNGAATIKLDPTFSQTVNTGTEYHVFLTPNGDSKGLYVSQKTATSFEVREQGGGVSSVAFDYRIVAKRVGYEKVRLADVTERFNQQEARSKNMRRPARSSADPRSLSQIPTPPAHPVVEQRLAPKMLVLPVLPSAAPRPAPVTPKLTPTPPVRAALQPTAAQPK